MPNEIAAPQGASQPTQSASTGNTRVYPQEEHKSLKVDSATRQYKVGILESALEVSIQAGNDSQALLFRTAIDRINEVLGTSEGPDALQKAAAQDNSPEATAGRILSFTTGLFAAYAAKRGDDDPQQVAKDFVDVIRGGFEKGFNEAKDILKGLNVLSGDVESGIGKTYDLVQKGLDDFLATLLKPKDNAEVPKQVEATAATAKTAVDAPAATAKSGA